MTTTEAYEQGINAGYDAANYADAYGWSSSRSGSKACDSSLYSFSGTAEEFEAGFAEGVRRFEADEWPDGSPRDND